MLNKIWKQIVSVLKQLNLYVFFESHFFFLFRLTQVNTSKNGHGNIGREKGPDVACVNIAKLGSK